MLREAAKGTVRIIESNEGYVFSRFTKAQEDYYKGESRALSSAGIRLKFKTDSKILKISANVTHASSREFFAFDIYKNGEQIGALTNIPDEGIEFIEGSVMPNTLKLPLGDFSGEYELGNGEKTVEIYFPWSVAPVLKNLEIDDNASFSAAHSKHKMIMFGDSITHGYDAFYPSHSYASLLADALTADAVNKGIGGEKFCPGLAELRDDFEPDFITVAYGSNDWNTRKRDDFENKCDRFYAYLSNNYPKAKIFAITPIWRGDKDQTKACGTLESVAEFIMDISKKYPNVIGIRGDSFVPEDPKYYSDFRLHPNDDGFKFYAQGLLNEIKKYL